MGSRAQDESRFQRLEELVRRAQTRGASALDAGELEELPQLYRFASSRLAQLDTAGSQPAHLERWSRLVSRAHGVLYRNLEPRSGSLLARTGRFLLQTSPRTIREEWRLVAASLALFYALAIVAFLAVRSDLDLSYSLLSAEAVEREIAQLAQTGPDRPFLGNFTFGIGSSSLVAGAILANNITVSVIFFGSALLPPLYLWLLARNALMLGTYTAVAGHWDQAWNISSIVWCHGVIELQMIVLAGAAGLVLVRGMLASGPWSRRHAMKLEAARAWALFAPVAPALVVAAFIEAFVSPHAPLGARMGIAVLTLAVLVVWAVFGGRSAAVTSSAGAPPAMPRAAEPPSGPRAH
jgi:uncharacterized membrane protein SpoIIM required for sporulation